MSETIRLFCWVLNTPIDQIFPVKVGRDEVWGTVKDTIKEKKKPDFNDIDADTLHLWKVTIGRSQRSLLESEDFLKTPMATNSLDPIGSLSKDLKDQLPDDHINIIIVQRPTLSTGLDLLSTPRIGGQSSFTNVLQHTPEKDKKDFEDSIQEFLDECRPAMETLVSKAGDIPSFMPSWTPGPMDSVPHLSDHILRLKIPRDKGGLPSLLLHDLGEEKSDLDKLRASRIPRIFSNNNTLLINTSGSGKSRILLEGLCRHWGFYFVAAGSPIVGSSDFYATFSTIDAARDYREARNLKGIDPLAFPHMGNTTERRLLQLLLSRLSLLHLFIDVAKRSATGLQQKEHCRLWTLLQVHPDIIKGHFCGDIFADLTGRLRHATSEILMSLVRKAHTNLCHLLAVPNGELTLYNVLDEVQEALTLCTGDYQSDNDQKTPRPLLRETYRVWSILLGSKFPLILSGTGINYQIINEILGSNFVKGEPYVRLHDIGAFDDPRSQAAYIQQYFPPTLFQTPAWNAFLSRAWAWLRGRYRTTAALILLLMQGGYNSPHRTINIYVTTFTAFRPNDGGLWVDAEPSLPTDIEVERILGSGPRFEKMSLPQLTMLADVVFTQFVYGSYSLSSIDSPYRATFVQYGFARHKTGTRTEVIDEPLIIFAALTWLKKQKQFSLLDCLRRDIHMHSTRRNGFEAYLAYYIREIFETPQKLDAVFTFRSDFASRTDLSWQHNAFELVTVSNAKVSPITKSSGPSSSIGFIAVSGQEVLEWIKTNDEKYVFCFPPESFGPDLLFYLRCQRSQKLLLAVVQCRKYEQVEQDCLIHGLRTVSPPWFWRSKNLEHKDAASAPFVQNDPNCPALAEATPEVLAKIPSPLSTGADYAILRVFASWPGDSGLDRSLHWKEVTQEQGKRHKMSEQQDSSELDPDRHPASSLNLENFVTISQKYDSAWFLGKAEIMVGLESSPRPARHEHNLRSTKRKFADEIDAV